MARASDDDARTLVDSGLAATLPVDVATVPTEVVASGSEPRQVDPAPMALSGSRYAVKRLLGAGGMGEVHLCRDGYLGRDVAMKVMREHPGEGSEGRARFLREARVQGQLEHPAIVPVYDLAIGADGRPYFTMKRIQGDTLRDVLERLGARDEATEKAWGRRRLLGALAQAAMAVAYAHARGVVHRDLKPENVMLGEFGEVYVLDWGVARAGELGADREPEGERHETPSPAAAFDSNAPLTAAGALVGTPGFMSPEQARGDVEATSPRSDVFSLGCVLFELLALTPAIEGRNVTALLLATLRGAIQTPSARAPQREIPPELDAICAKALALEPDERFATARELAVALEGYLDGERDAELRQNLAQQHLEDARAALSKAAEGGDVAHEARTRGMRELGKALALDPGNPEAFELVTRIVLAPSTDLPAAAEAELKKVELADRTKSARRSSTVYAAFILFLPLMHWMGMRNLRVSALMLALSVAATLYDRWMAVTGNAAPRFMRVSIAINFVLVGSYSAFFGPLVFVPGVACTIAAMYVTAIRATYNTRQLLFGFALASVVLPLGAEWAGLLPPSYAFQDGALVLLPRAFGFPPVPTLLFLLVGFLFQLTASLKIIGASVDSLKAAERQNFAQAFRLRQLLG